MIQLPHASSDMYRMDEFGKRSEHAQAMRLAGMSAGQLEMLYLTIIM
jgi:hypothetical protein